MPEDGRRTRVAALRAAALAGGALVGGVLLEWRPGRAQGQSSGSDDTEVLNLALLFEYVQAGLYEAALRTGRLEGELREFAEVAGGHEREHAELLERTLGGDARQRPQLEFGDAAASPRAFERSARQIEDLAVRAYNAGAPSLSADALLAAGRIVSVHARHSAWIRDLAGDVPAPDAAEPQLSVEQITQQLDRLGWVR